MRMTALQIAEMPTKCAYGCGLRVQFSGVYRKGHQPVGTSPDPAGLVKAANDYHNPINHPIHNPIHNPINNPINNKRVQEAAREENEERIARIAKDEPFITEAMAAATADTPSRRCLGSSSRAAHSRSSCSSRKRPQPAGGRYIRLLLRLHGPSDQG